MSSLSELSRSEVERRIERLREEYGRFPVVTTTHEDDPAMFEHGREIVEAGHVGGSGAVILEDGRLLLVYHDSRQRWEPPAGSHEPEETLEETARREVREETGVECRITGVHRVNRMRFVHRDDPERRGYLLDVHFEADHVSGSPHPRDEEVAEVDWFGAPPEPLHDAVAPGTGVWSSG